MLRRIKIEMVTSARLQDVAAALDLVAANADDVKIDVVTVGDLKRVLADKGRGPKTDDPRLVSHQGADNYRDAIDIAQSLTKLGLTEHDLFSRSWGRGSSEHAVKMAVVARRRHANGPTSEKQS